ncbi:putative D-lactate dehydrogenase (cytochrome) [Aspergillus aculeatinus CBS 121060]|uniref:Uncharacterized protein n=1 Tax=Aspergillus aculeatinus CBS 121060 TaxID=1448322 RepID=A0ACD1HNG7_9EURO|nr:hypothetical protein BO66DRAFT_416693 [Aspergillus aculeatinus CBS 121060]RAH75414.1 hypothetical protein BO66DRAFT_416693 [Aspergillus aculeatinus CBS 121060]
MRSFYRTLARSGIQCSQTNRRWAGRVHFHHARPETANSRNSLSFSWPWVIVGAGATGLAGFTWQLSPWAAGQSDKQPIFYADRKTMLRASSIYTGVQEIADTLGPDSVSTSHCATRPVAVVTPRTTDEVSTITHICSKYRIPMIPFGGGSSVEGNFTAPHSGISIDFSQMNKIIAFHEEDMDVVVQPGVNWMDLNNEIKDSGLFLPMDPSPTALIGGMVATNCSGTNAVRYGTMKDWVISLTVVLANGTVVKTRHRPRKSSSGYNLSSLFTGSEGTLGMITEVTLKLAPIPERQSVAVATFPSITDAVTCTSRIMRQRIPIAAVELMDETQMEVLNRNGGAGGRMWDEKPTLLFKFSGTAQSIATDIGRVEDIVSQGGGSAFQFAKTELEMHNLWSARKEAIWAMCAQKPDGMQLWSTDVAVPLSQLPLIIELSKQESQKLGLFSSILGHVGDGNFHQAVMYDPNSAYQTEAVRDCVKKMVHRAVQMEGTVSGEHGIGLGKKECLLEELGQETVAVMKTLKRSLDPHFLMNPGKVFD